MRLWVTALYLAILTQTLTAQSNPDISAKAKSPAPQAHSDSHLRWRRRGGWPHRRWRRWSRISRSARWFSTRTESATSNTPGPSFGNQRVAIDFTSPQLNDVLQSLTVLDEGGGRIAGVNYNSTTPLAEQLKTLSLGMNEDPTSTDLFERTARPASRSNRRTSQLAEPIAGRLMSIEGRTEKSGSDENARVHRHVLPHAHCQFRSGPRHRAHALAQRAPYRSQPSGRTRSISRATFFDPLHWPAPSHA